MHDTDARKRREKPFNQYFIDQFAVFCNMLIKKSLSTEVYESTFTLQLHTMLLRIPRQQGQQLNLQQNSRTFEFKTPVNTDFIIYGISNPFFCPKITRVVHQLRMFTFHENLFFFSHLCVTAPVFLARFSLFMLPFNQNLKWRKLYKQQKSLLCSCIRISVHVYMLWFNFILGLNSIFFCFWVWSR